ncbi:MAG: trans-aconitate 2-methyltransferase [Chloroflexi bacterium]|nr:trans-aconitate 2-methyltransferase [Chloroflexota bacterium]
MTDWNPAQYLRFGGERLRPALDLMTRIQLDSPETVYDLGCGTGTITGILKERWPESKVTGVDSSASMLERTRDVETGVYWQHADLNDWRPDSPADVVYTNAALHWLDNHEQLFPRLMGVVKPGGVLAVQMPENFSAPSHTSIADTVREGAWRERLAPFQREQPVSEPSFYYDMLSPLSSSIDMWETTYMHILEGEDPVVEWTKGTMLRPLLDNLSPEEGEEFVASYTKKVAKAYPRRANGKTVLPFKRLFIVAVK